MFLITDNKIYEVNFGLKGLKIYSECLNQVAEENQLSLLLYCGLITNHPDITFDEIDKIIEQCDVSQIITPPFFSPFIYAELYTKAVGEIGIEPAEFLKMSPEEIDLAYEGYLRRQELTANLTKLAFVEALNNNNKLIRLTENKGYIIGNDVEREETLKKLGIE